MDETLRFAVVGIAAPALIGVMAGVGAAMIKGGKPASSATRAAASGGRVEVGFIGARAVAVVGVTVAAFLSMFGVYGMLKWPPGQMSERLFLMAPIVGAVGLAGLFITAWRGAHSVGGSRELGWWVSAACGGVGAAIATAVALGKPLWEGTLAPYGSAVWVPLVFGAWSALGAWSVGSVVRRGARISGAIVLVGLCAAVGAGMTGTFNQELGKNGFAIAAVTAGLALGVLTLRGAIGPGAISVICAMLGTIVACGTLMGHDVPWWVPAGLGCVGPSAWLADVVVARRMGAVGGAVVRVGVAALLAAAIVAPGILALLKFANGEG